MKLHVFFVAPITGMIVYFLNVLYMLHSCDQVAEFIGYPLAVFAPSMVLYCLVIGFMVGMGWIEVRKPSEFAWTLLGFVISQAGSYVFVTYSG